MALLRYRSLGGMITMITMITTFAAAFLKLDVLTTMQKPVIWSTKTN